MASRDRQRHSGSFAGRGAWLLAGWLAALALPAAAEPRPAAERPSATRSPAARPPAARPMRFDRLSLEEGLSQVVVYSIFQDSTGFLWLGTQGGLNRYDGYRFEVYRHDAQDPASLPHDWVIVLAEDRTAAGPSGDLWLGTQGGGLARWRRASDSFVTYRHDPQDPRSLSGDEVVALAWGGDGGLWVGTHRSGLNRFDPVTETFERFRHDPADPGSLSDDQVSTLYADTAGNLWVGTAGGLDLVAPDRVAAFSHFRHDPQDPASLSDNRVRAIVEDRAGGLWVGTHGGLNRRLASGGFERFGHDPQVPGSLSHNWVRALYQDSDGRLWVGTDGGLNLRLGEANRFASYRPEPDNRHSLSNSQVVSIYQDRGGVLWVGTLGGGVNRWNPATWSFSHHRPSASGEEGASDMVFAVSQDRAGDLWLGTFGGGLERVARDSGRSTRYRHDPVDDLSLSDDRVTALLHDRDGTLWAGTVAGGLNRFDAASGGFERFRHDPRDDSSLSADAVTALHQDRHGRLWIGTWTAGLNLHRGGGSFSRFRHHARDPTSLGHDRVFSLAEDAAGRLWIATDGGGLTRLDLGAPPEPPSGPRSGVAFLRLQHRPSEADSLASDELIAVHVDPQDGVWAGTKSAGLERLMTLDEVSGRAVWKSYSKADGLPDETIWGIESDAGGGLWLATGHGLSRFDPEAETFKSYDTSHGLLSMEFNQGAHYASPSGELFFGGTRGVDTFFPEHVESNAHVPPVVLVGLSRFGETMDAGRPLFDLDQVRFSYRDHFVAFELAALDFAAPEKNRYRYRLEGFDDGWVELGTERRVSFASLQPGRYTLRVQGSNNDGAWNRDGASVAIYVAPPPWRTWWAYALYALAASAAVVGFVSFQQRRVERANRIAHRERAQAEDRAALIVELETKNAELERFNYTVSHDLKSPLVTITGFLGLLRKDATRGDLERLEHDIRRIGAATGRMRQLLDELLELSTVGSKVRPPKRLPLSELAAQAREIIAGELEARGVEVVIDPGLPVVFGDRVRLLQLYQNLMANGAKYMGTQSAPRIEVGARRDGEQQVMFVRDNGIGIDQQYHEKVFGLFERLDAAGEGTGIGLALAKRVVEMHGGHIWVESEGPGHGSCFCFTVARQRIEDAADRPDEDRPALEARRIGS